ncbi:GNAT domain-containing protein [Pseudomassariella vexata]|uniref:GNAT domain-domain-containing protein n=1 Tax=Pseudomassariella vexata TaxID=1141098 RepID=A0A1Y2EJG2_9PEZI|nr:GNAT domain-containing protein [Pseudomassariella vexata]ORY71709.1 GNAT domain-domain-containing protein [Pseudomassariella vexata]
MKLNENTAISTSKVLLVPYDAHHVPQYHHWMEDPAIQEATASEPLTLEEEYENQQSWRTSSDKLTFIVCQPVPVLPGSSSNGGDSEKDQQPPIIAGKADAADRMVGDINLFLTPWEDDIDGADNSTPAPSDRKDYVVGEVDIMIADLANRGKGLGKAAVSAFLLFIRRNLRAILDEYAAGTGRGVAGKTRRPEMRAFMVKIKATNVGSMALFTGLGFVQRGEVNYFGEVEMGLDLLNGLGTAVGDDASGGYREVIYDRSKLET